MSQTVSQAQAVDEALAGMPLSRREFLYYLWGISMALFLAFSGGATIWFALPRFRVGEFGGTFTLDVADVPPVDSGPKSFAQGRFWLVNLGPKTLRDVRQPRDYPLEAGVKALYMVCVHLGCLYKWVLTQDRFECPCHGSKFLRSSARIDGPARRNLDVFVIEVVDARGNVLARTDPTISKQEGATVSIPPEATALRIKTAERILGAPNTRPGGGL